MTEPTKPPVRKPRKREDLSEKPVTFLPQGNPNAARAYLCVVFGIIPVVGLVLSLPAMIFGFLGYRSAKKDPERKGLAHCFVAIGLGFLELLFNGLGTFFTARYFGWI